MPTFFPYYFNGHIRKAMGRRSGMLADVKFGKGIEKILSLTSSFYVDVRYATIFVLELNLLDDIRERVSQNYDGSFII